MAEAEARRMTRPTSPFAAPPTLKRKAPRSKQEPSTSMRAYLKQRDKGCVAPLLVGYGVSSMSDCQGSLQVDHVRASGGLGMKSPATRDNLLLLCAWHHKAKTEYGKVWRPLLVAYLERVEK